MVGNSTIKKSGWIITVLLTATFLLSPISLCLSEPITINQALAESGSNEGTFGPAIAADKLGLTSSNVYIFAILSSLGFAVAYIGGNMLDVSAGVFTSHMYNVIENFGIDNSIQSSWTVIRDLFNLFFIFGLILIGFQLILGINESSSKKTLGSLIVAALLINFSLYAAELLVDFSNVLSYQISNLISTNTTETLFGLTYPEISNGFTNLSGVEVTSQTKGLSGLQGEPLFNGGIDNIWSAIVLGFLFLIFYMILGFVFAAGAFVLFARFLALIILLILSPIFFIGMVLPYFKSLGDMWQKHFVKNLLVGPAYLFMLYLSLRSLQGLGGINADFSLIGFIFQLLIVVGFLMGSLTVAKQIGSFGANQATSMSKRLTRAYGTVAAGATAGRLASGLRNTVGRYAQNRAESESLRDAASRRGVKGFVARRKLGAARLVGDSSFDARKIGGVGQKLGVGEGYKGGYATRTKEVAEREEKFAESLGQVSSEDPQVIKLQTDVDAAEKSIKDKQKTIREKQKERAGKKTDEERRELQAQIDATRSEIEAEQEELTKKKEGLQRERQRRQTGTETAVPKSVLDTRKTLKERLGDDLNSFNEAKTDAEKETARDKIAKTKKEIAELEDQINNVAGGYGATVTSFGTIKNFFMSRTVEQNKEAGKKIRETYTKKAKGV